MYGLREFENQKFAIPFEDAPGLGRYNCYGFKIPYKRYNRTLGDFSVDSLLSTIAPSSSNFSVNSTLLYAGVAVLGVAVLLHYTRKTGKKYRSYRRRQAQRAERKKALKAELAKL